MDCPYKRDDAPDAECDNECLLRDNFKDCDYMADDWTRCRRTPKEVKI